MTLEKDDHAWAVDPCQIDFCTLKVPRLPLKGMIKKGLHSRPPPKKNKQTKQQAISFIQL